MTLIIAYPGIQQPVSVRYTRGLGTRPGHAVLEFLPQSTPVSPVGTLSIGFDGFGVNLPKCRADFGTVQWSVSGQMVIMKLFDRRWAWHAGNETGQPAGEISGRYNVRRTDGSIDPVTERTPQALASLLLNAMGEGLYDVSQLPSDPRPYVDWDYDHPATELDRLCETLGCRVALKIATDTVQIVRLGFGGTIGTIDAFREQQTWDLAESPDSLKVVGSEALYQSKLKLRAVGLDTDGRVRLIDDLSYAPDNGWGGIAPPFTSITDSTSRELAEATVWRWYQIESQADGTQVVPGYTDIQYIDNLKPINRYLVETYLDTESGRQIPQEAFVDGVWFTGDPTAGPAVNTDKQTKYNGYFTIDTDNGIVRFSDEVYKVDEDARKEADIFLTCSYEARDPNTLAFSRYVQFRNLGGTAGTGPKIIKRPDILFASYATYDEDNQVTEVVTNQALCQAEAIAQLDATQAQYTASQGYDIGFNGIKQIDIDGVTRQITFKIDTQDRSPRGGAETYVSLNSETDPYVPRYSSRQSTRGIPTGIVPPRRFPRP